MNAKRQRWDVFIAYASDDVEIIREIVNDLQKRGVNCWIDEEQIQPGDPVAETIENGLHASHAILLCFSKNHLQSGWCRTEYTAILNQYFSGTTQQKVYPLLLDDITEDELPLLFRNNKCAKHSDQSSYKRLLGKLVKKRHSKTESESSKKYQITAEDTNRIRREYNKAQAYQQSDPAACLSTSRRIAEDICKQLLQAEIDVSPRGKKGKHQGLYKVIQQLNTEGVLPSTIVAPLQVIQNFGNVGAHPQIKHAKHLTPDYVKPCMDSLGIVVKWYLERYPFPESDADKPPTIPEPSEHIRNFLPPFIHDQYEQGNLQGNFEALTLCVDAVGFTKMTEQLMRHGPAGAEVLAEIMNKVFNPLVQAVYGQSGFISVFAGDAFTAIFPAQPESSSETILLRGLACIDNLQTLFVRHGIHRTTFGQFTLEFKVGLSYGDVKWGIVGETRNAYYFRGRAIEACASVQKHAEKGDILFDESLGRQLGKLTEKYGGSWKTTRLAGGDYQLHEIPSAIQAQFPPPQPAAAAQPRQDILARFLPARVLELKGAGEFRNIAAVFLGFQADASHEVFRAWGALLLEHVAAYGGYLSQFDVSEKGHTALCLFGAPVGVEDPVDRALDCLWTLRRKIHASEVLTGLTFRAGLAYGMAYTGIVGGKRQCVYTCYSATVNLAARVMEQADWGEIYLPRSASDKTELFSFTPVDDMLYKGFAEQIPTVRVFWRKYGVRKRAFSERLIGRQRELRKLHQCLAPIFQGKFGEVVTVHGEAGIGKSHLTEILRQEVTVTHEVNWFLCPTDSILRKAFNPFITLLSRYFELSPEVSESENQARFEEVYEVLLTSLGYLISAPEEEINAEFPTFNREQGREVRTQLERTKSVIGGLLELHWPGSLWEDLDPKGRHENILQSLTAFFVAHSLIHPTVIELEDGHDLDPWSRAVLEALTRHVIQSPTPLLILCTSRSRDDGSKVDFGLQGVGEYSLLLDYLPSDAMKEQAEAELQGAITPELHAWLSDNTLGNPFFVQQALRHFKDIEIIVQKNGDWHLRPERSAVPDSIENILIARLDRLSIEVKEAVKTASVIGREFDIQLLSAVLQRDVRENDPILLEARQANIWDINLWDIYQQILVIFKHALFRETAYQMLLIAQRKALHEITAQAIERLYSENKRLELYLADLAFHYEHAEQSEKAIEYLTKAGDQAKARYQNQQALNFYDRLLAQLHHTFGQSDLEIDTLLKQAEILELTGEWKACQQVCQEALRLSEQLDDTRRMGQANRELGVIFQQTAEYMEAMGYFEKALELFETVEDRANIGRVFAGMGIIHWQKNEYDAALAYYEKALENSKLAGDISRTAINMNNMGVIYDLRSDYTIAMEWYEKSLEICTTLGDKLEMSRVLNNIGECYRETLGNYKAAMPYYEQTLRIATELGAKLLLATTSGNIGHVYKAQDDYQHALASYDSAITIARELENKYLLSEYLINKADALFLLQHYEEAKLLNEEGSHIAKETGRSDCILQGHILSAKTEFALGDTSAPNRLDEMLSHTQDDTAIATICYEHWRMTRNKERRQTALNVYHTLYKRIPHIEYKRRIEEMSKSSSLP